MVALRDVRIVEIATSVAEEYCGKLLADFGAEVIKIEPPAGSPTRKIGPLHDGKSAVFSYLNTNKKSVVLNLEDSADVAMLERLLGQSHALIGSSTAAMRAASGRKELVHCAITPFGQSATPAMQNAHSIHIMAASGWAYHTPSEAQMDKVPLKGAGRFMADYEAGLEAALCVAASLWRQRNASDATGRGQFIDINAVAALLSRTDCVVGRMLAGEAPCGPERTHFDMGGPGTTFACRDGFVFLFMTTKQHWSSLCALMGNPAWAEDFPADWLEFHCTPDRVAAFRTHFTGWIAQQDKHAISRAAQQSGVALVPVNTAADLPDNAQYQHRGYFQTFGGLSYPTVPYRMSASPARIHSHAPELGAHQQELPL